MKIEELKKKWESEGVKLSEYKMGADSITSFLFTDSYKVVLGTTKRLSPEQLAAVRSALDGILIPPV